MLLPVLFHCLGDWRTYSGITFRIHAIWQHCGVESEDLNDWLTESFWTQGYQSLPGEPPTGRKSLSVEDAREQLERKKSLLGEYDRVTLDALFDLARAHLDDGNIRSAIRELKKVIEGRARIQDHDPDVDLAEFLLAGLLALEPRTRSSAMLIQERLFATSLRKHGWSKQTSVFASCLADTYGDLGRSLDESRLRGQLAETRHRPRGS